MIIKNIQKVRNMKKLLEKQNKIFRFCKQSASRASVRDFNCRQLNVALRCQRTKPLGGVEK